MVVIILLELTAGPPAEVVAAKRYLAAWTRGDYAAMHAELGADDRRAISLRTFTAAYRTAGATATTTAVAHGRIGDLRDGVITVPMSVTTRVFGTVRARLRLPFAGEGDDAHIEWTPNLVFPGLRVGERLERRTTLPPRADILARDATACARSATRAT